MQKNLIIIALVAALGVALYMYQEEKKTTTIKLGDAKIEFHE